MATLVLPTNSPLANPHVHAWIARVSKAATGAIGFLPHEARVRHHYKGLILTAEEEGDLVAFNIRSPLQPGGTIQIHQAFTIDPARRLDHQTQILCRIAMQARAEGANAIVLKCGDDLEANAFWEAVGFVRTDQTRGGRRRGRLINHFRLPL